MPFWWFTPTVLFLGSGFVAATWNAEGALGLAATSVKSVIAPDQLGAEEESSNLYRVIESFDLWFTIRSSPITGRGFGQQFLMPLPLPDISFVEFWQYIPHNSILYMWIKLGFFGFAVMFFMFFRGVQFGARSTLGARTGDDVATVFAGMASVVMFVVFAYVDIAWDTRSTVFLAVAFALCADYAVLPETVLLRQPEARAWPEMLLREVRRWAVVVAAASVLAACSSDTPSFEPGTACGRIDRSRCADHSDCRRPSRTRATPSSCRSSLASSTSRSAH